MPYTHKQNFSITSTSGVTSLSGSDSETGNTELTFDVNLAASTTNQLQAMTFTYASLQSVVLLATQNCTIKTNSTGSPPTTINLIAGIPFVWNVSSGYFANPFSAANVTAFYLSCTAACRLQARILTS